MPRLTAWFGEQPYTYSGVTHDAQLEWPSEIQELRNRLDEIIGIRFNSLLCNCYRDGHDSIDWHSDDEASLGTNPTIASLSFGDTRVFEMRKKPPPGHPVDYTFSQRVRVPLVSGSLLIMEGATQADWQHKVPKEYHDRGPRINLTFRVICPEKT
ncbi:alpha-ketoglutarate-dependent dioxygenase alkB homolog 3-like isoform X2 [Littorina saxatilis]